MEARAGSRVPVWVVAAAVAVSSLLTVAVSRYGEYVVGTLDRYRMRSRARSIGDAGCTEVKVKPPFPAEIVMLLEASTLCYLSTQINGLPHLSLMNFTYVREDEKIVMSTRRNTTKFQAMIRMPNVALLCHDFPTTTASRECADSNTGEGSTYTMTNSITLYGKAKIETGESAEKYRALHLKRHGERQEAFIVGEGIAIVTVDVSHAKICNAKDQVKEWHAGEQSRK